MDLNSFVYLHSQSIADGAGRLAAASRSSVFLFLRFFGLPPSVPFCLDVLPAINLLNPG